mmetsp:Transcript_54381/g.157237  ORF Transcript_54381/g.157237 Transcript_54381/m.157237 type:complete len:333 (+) Transcript_54381:1459-2457(+)
MAPGLKLAVVHDILRLSLIRLGLHNGAGVAIDRGVRILRIKVHNDAQNLQRDVDDLLLLIPGEVAAIGHTPANGIVAEDSGHQAAEQVRGVADLAASKPQEPSWRLLLVLVGRLEERAREACENTAQDLHAGPDDGLRHRHGGDLGRGPDAALPDHPVVHPVRWDRPAVLAGHLRPGGYGVPREEEEPAYVVEDVVPEDRCGGRRRWGHGGERRCHCLQGLGRRWRGRGDVAVGKGLFGGRLQRRFGYAVGRQRTRLANRKSGRADSVTSRSPQDAGQHLVLFVLHEEGDNPCEQSDGGVGRCLLRRRQRSALVGCAAHLGHRRDGTSQQGL